MWTPRIRQVFSKCVVLVLCCKFFASLLLANLELLQLLVSVLKKYNFFAHIIPPSLLFFSGDAAEEDEKARKEREKARYEEKKRLQAVQEEKLRAYKPRNKGTVNMNEALEVIEWTNFVFLFWEIIYFFSRGVVIVFSESRYTGLYILEKEREITI